VTTGTPTRDHVSRKLFGKAAPYLDVIGQLLPRLLTHRYQFMPNAIFEAWITEGKAPLEQINQVHVGELLDNAHLAATTALVRTNHWANAMVDAYLGSNFLSWSAAARGLVESSGDIGDGLLNIPASLAEHHKMLSRALAGRHAASPLNLSSIEEVLSHYIRAKWTREKTGDVPKAKENIEYVRWIERANVPGVVSLYHKLCGIVHPASGSIDYLYAKDIQGLRLDLNRGATAIDTLCSEYPNVIPTSLMLACNGAFLTLRVLHKFHRHPQLPELKLLDWRQIRMWADIEAFLNR
jgi:hypothetical protein